MSSLIKRLSRLLFRDYSIYRIYTYCYDDEIASTVRPPNKKFRFEVVAESEIRDSRDELVVEQAWYHGREAYAYGCFQDARLVALCFFWYGNRYTAKRNFWPLSAGEAKLVQLIVLPELRGRGIARDLVRFATDDMFHRGFKRIYSRIWWSNTPSLNVFEHAGWQRVATVIELCIPGRRRPLRLQWMKKSF
jgi:RimJ/RimL family protein N-acetyltransferase